MGGRPVGQQGMPQVNLQAMPQYSHHSTPQYTGPSNATLEAEHKPNPEALLAYRRQSSSTNSMPPPAGHNPSQQMLALFQGQQQVLFSIIVVIVRKHDHRVSFLFCVLQIDAWKHACQMSFLDLHCMQCQRTFCPQAYLAARSSSCVT